MVSFDFLRSAKFGEFGTSIVLSIALAYPGYIIQKRKIRRIASATNKKPESEHKPQTDIITKETKPELMGAYFYRHFWHSHKHI